MPRERIVSINFPTAAPVGETSVDLFRLPIDEARKVRWERGRDARRGEHEPFVGNPLYEAYEEMLDTLNYFDEAERQSQGAAYVAEWRCVVRAMAERMRYLATPPWEEYKPSC